MEVQQDILQTIVAHKLKELIVQKENVSASELEQLISNSPVLSLHSLSMKKALQTSDTGIIAEFKRKSPSKGWIKENGTPETIPTDYALHGASAISILTDETFFGGKLDYIRRARPLISSTPILRKDFIIDEYQLFQAKQVGANAVLLIASCLTKERCKQLAHMAKELSLESLLEIHSEQELDWINDDIDMIGVNNRHLGTFHTNVETSFKLASLLPPELIHVSESGISDPMTVKQLRDVGYKGFLIGETFMKTKNPGESLSNFIKEIHS